MTAREHQLYAVGVLLGQSHGLDIAAKHVHELAERLRAYPAAKQAAMWCDQAAQNVASLKHGQRRAQEIAIALREFGKKLVVGHEELANMVELSGVAIAQQATKFKSQFAAALAEVPPDVVRTIGEPKRGKPKAKGIGARVLGRVAEGLKEIAEREPK